MEVLDLDGDSDLDVALLAFSSVIHVLKNGGDGAFSPPDRIPATGAFFMTAADVTGDGVPDLVTTHANDDRVSLFPNRGDGTFGDPIVSEVGDAPSSAAAGDLDGDGDLDLAVTIRSSGTVTILRHNGDGTFAVAGTFQVSSSISSLVKAADLDGDGATSTWRQRPAPRCRS